MNPRSMLRGPASGSRWQLRAPAIGLVITLLLILAACSGAGTQSSAPAQTAEGNAASATTQTHEGGNVTVEVTWQGRDSGPVFQVTLDTHSVDLDGIDLAQLASLRTDQGALFQPVSWDAPKGGHHREGTLRFPETNDGNPVIGPSTQSLELIVRDVAGVPERIFRWTV